MKALTLINAVWFWLSCIVAFMLKSFLLGVVLILGGLCLEIIALILYGKYLDNKEKRELYDKDGNLQL